MEKLPDDSYHAKASRRTARLIALHLSWIVWAVIGIDTIPESLRGESLRRPEGDQSPCEREPTATVGEFIEVLKKTKKGDAEAFATTARQAEEVLAPSSSPPPPPPVELLSRFPYLLSLRRGRRSSGTAVRPAPILRISSGGGRALRGTPADEEGEVRCRRERSPQSNGRSSSGALWN